MRVITAVLLGAGLVVGLASWLIFRKEAPQASSEGASAASPGEAQNGAAPSPTGVRLLEQNPFIEDYGKEGGSFQKDLEALRDVVNDCQLLLKDFDRYHLPGNPEMTRFLQGANPEKLAWIPPGHSAVNAAGELLDRAGTPVFFHRLSGRHFEFRSAGPDGELWTDDDVILP